MKRMPLTPSESSEHSQTMGSRITVGWISSSRSTPDATGIIRVFTGPPGISTLAVTPVPSRSCAMMWVCASSAALDGP